MPTLLHTLSYVATGAAIVFVTLSLAGSLLWLAELIEENSKTAKTVGMRICYAIIALHAALWVVDRLPAHLIAFGIFCHGIYLLNFSSTWPTISLTSWHFLLSCVLVVTDHFLWFFHFAHLSQRSRRAGTHARSSYSQNSYALQHQPTFAEISGFFGLCVWLIPLFLFLSLSANDNALPTSQGTPSPSRTDFTQVQVDGKGGKPSMSITTQPRQSLFKTIFDPIFDLLSTLRLRRASRRSQSQGLIAPPTPNRTSMTIPRPMTPNGMTSPLTPVPLSPQLGYASASPDWRGQTPVLSKPPPSRRVTTDGTVWPSSPRLDTPGEPHSVRRREAGSGRSASPENIGLGFKMD